MFGTEWRLGKIGGVELRIDASWSVIAFLVGYTFFLTLRARFGDASLTNLVVLAGVMAVVFFACVLIHELAHAWMSRARDVEVKGITLFLFGGATHAKLDTKGPKDELVIAAVGPITSIALAAIFWGLTQVAGSGPIAFATGQLGWINLALAVFNLVPGFPLDGGRILRSIVWWNTDDLVRATRIAARAGQVVGYLLIGLGILQVFIGLLVQGLWLAAIGWFLAQSAQNSFVQLQLRRVLSRVEASEVMSRQAVGVPGDITLQQAVDDYFMRHDYNAFPVSEGAHTSGVLTLAAVREVPREDWSVRRVMDVMRPLSEECTARPTDSMDGVLEKISGGEVRRVLVVEDGEVLGLITPRDVARWMERSQALGLTELRG